MPIAKPTVDTLVALNVSPVALRHALKKPSLAATIEFLTELQDAFGKALPWSIDEEHAAEIIATLMVSVDEQLLGHEDTEPPYAMDMLETAVWMYAEEIEGIAGPKVRESIEAACGE